MGLRGLAASMVREWERLGGLTYHVRRAILLEFGVQVTLWQKRHEPRFAIDWSLDLGDEWWWQDCDEDDS